MLLDKLKRITIAVLVIFLTTQVFAATTDLAVRFRVPSRDRTDDNQIHNLALYR